MISVDTPVFFSGVDKGGLTVTGLQAQVSGAWQPVAGALSGTAGWLASAEEPTGCDEPGTGQTVTTEKLAAVSGGLRWTFSTGGGCNPALHRQDFPAALPAVVASGLKLQPNVPQQAIGLDGRALAIEPAALLP